MRVASLASGGKQFPCLLTQLLLHLVPLLTPLTKTGAGSALAVLQDVIPCDAADGSCPIAASQELLQREVQNDLGVILSARDLGLKEHFDQEGKNESQHKDDKSKVKQLKKGGKNKTKHEDVEKGGENMKHEDGKNKTKHVEHEGKHGSKHVVIKLRSKDFANGSYIIKQPGTYVLQEAIVFEPDTPGHLPLRNSTVYKKADGYWLGFFAAIVVTSSDVVIDLNGYSISMSFKFSVVQRFFSIIQLGSKPFLSSQGPPQFAMSSVDPKYASRVEIKNGTLGRSSHMGIHGNNIFGLHIHDTKIKDFETGGIQLNGAESVTIERCTIGPSLGAPGSPNKVPGLAVFTQATLLAKLAEGTDHHKEQEVRELTAVIQSYTASLNHTEIPTPNADAYFFTDPDTYSGLPDGAALYGISLHKTGVAIHDFAMCSWAQATAQLKDDPFTNFTIKDVVIQDLSLKSDEVVTMSVNGLPVRGPAGDTIQVLKLKDAYDGYKGTALSNAQRRLAELKLQATEDGVSEEDIFNLYGSTNIPPGVLSWMQGNGSFADAVAGADFECQKDSMGHRNKGVVGLRLDFGVEVIVSNVNITRLQNFGHRSVFHDFCSAEINEEFDYKGSDVRGVSLGRGTSLTVSDVMDHVALDEASFYSASGWVYPIKKEERVGVAGNSEVVTVEREVLAPVLFR